LVIIIMRLIMVKLIYLATGRSRLMTTPASQVSGWSAVIMCIQGIMKPMWISSPVGNATGGMRAAEVLLAVLAALEPLLRQRRELMEPWVDVMLYLPVLQDMPEQRSLYSQMIPSIWVQAQESSLPAVMEGMAEMAKSAIMQRILIPRLRVPEGEAVPAAAEAAYSLYIQQPW
jgi:hypothetical protein